MKTVPDASVYVIRVGCGAVLALTSTTMTVSALQHIAGRCACDAISDQTSLMKVMQTHPGGVSTRRAEAERTREAATVAAVIVFMVNDCRVRVRTRSVRAEGKKERTMFTYVEMTVRRR